MNSHDIDWRSISLFHRLPEDMVEKVKPIFDIMSVEAGNDLIREGEEGDEMFILVHGQVRITKSMLIKDMHIPLLEVDNPRKVLATLDEADYPIFGEIALIDRDTRSATIQVLQNSDFLVTNRARFFRLMEQEPALGGKLLLALAQRMATTVRRGNSELVKVSTALALALSKFKAM